jgi:isocitrate dehydrogenase
MFEAIHGSAPDIAGRGIANPSGLLQAAVMMLVHLRQADVAARVHDAWLAAIEDGVHTADLCGDGGGAQPCTTGQFADAVIQRLGRRPRRFAPANFSNPAPGRPAAPRSDTRSVADKRMVGVDVFVHAREVSPDALAARLLALATPALSLQMITNRGVKVWPGGLPETFCTDHWRCRFVASDGAATVAHAQVIELLQRLDAAGVDFIKTENLCTFDGALGFALGQGQ